MELKKPLVFLDFEATGLDVNTDRIIEIAYIKMMPDGSEEAKSKKLNPGIPIPPESTNIHGITDEDVKDLPTFAQMAKALHSILEGCDFGGFNLISYDLPLLYNEFKRCGIDFNYLEANILDCGNVFKRKNPRNLAAAYEHYTSKTLENAHSAAADIKATQEVFLKQVENYGLDTVDSFALYSNYDRVQMDVDNKFYKDKDGVKFNFGKYQNELIGSNPDHKGFLDWMLTKDFSQNTKNFIESLKE